MSDESLFREVDEEVRQEQFKKLWARYGSAIIGASLLVIVGVAGFKGWQYWQLKQSQAAAESFFSAVKQAGDGKADEAIASFKTIEHSGFGVLARLREAGVMASQGKADAAVKIYDAVAADGSADAALRDLARMRAALALADTATPADLEARLKGFDTVGNPWRHSAREIMAFAYWKTQDFTAADKQVQAILADTEAPAGIRQRAQMLHDLLVPALAKT